MVTAGVDAANDLGAGLLLSPCIFPTNGGRPPLTPLMDSAVTGRVGLLEIGLGVANRPGDRPLPARCKPLLDAMILPLVPDTVRADGVASGGNSMVGGADL